MHGMPGILTSASYLPIPSVEDWTRSMRNRESIMVLLRRHDQFEISQVSEQQTFQRALA